MRRLGVSVILCFVFWWSLAHGYEERVHRMLEERALPAELLDAPIAPEVVSLRSIVWKAGAEHSDPEVRRRFLARWPSEWDDWGFKEFLGLTPEAKVIGIDVLPTLGAAPRVRDVLIPAASQPDEDRRNRDRFAHDARRQVKLDPWGRPLPADPAQLDMGPLRGLASQAYAHYGLPKVTFSADAEVLKTEPRRWAYPPTARAFAPEFAQLFTDLALMAAARGGERDALAWLFLGHAHHYLGDVCNQIHTLQAIYPFFYDAKIESYKEEFLTLGGLLRARKGFVSIGIDIIGNHHLLAENFWGKRVFEGTDPVVKAGVAKIVTGDPAFEERLAQLTDPAFGREMTEVAVDAASYEGGAVYQAIHDLAQTRISRAGVKFEDGMDPDAFIRPDPEPRALRQFYDLAATGFARAGTALRRHVAAFRQAIGHPGAAERLVATQLSALEARESRLASYVPKPPETAQINWVVPGGLLAILIFGSLLVRRIIVRLRRRRRS